LLIPCYYPPCTDNSVSVIISFVWVNDSTLLVCTIPLSRGDPPRKPLVPSGPKIQSNEQKNVIQARTYQDLLKDEYDEDFYEQEKPMWKKNEKLDGYTISNSEDKMKRANAQTKWKEPPRTEAKYSNSDDDLNALLKVNLFCGKLRNFT